MLNNLDKRDNAGSDDDEDEEEDMGSDMAIDDQIINWD